MKKLDEVSRSLSSEIKDHFLERLPDAELEIVVEAALSELAEYGPIQTNTNLLPVCHRIWARCPGIEFKPQRDIESALSSKAGSPIQDIRSIVRTLMRAEDLEKMLLQERTRIDSTLKYLARGNRRSRGVLRQRAAYESSVLLTLRPGRRAPRHLQPTRERVVREDSGLPTRGRHVSAADG